jgi:hypothetical protein
MIFGWIQKGFAQNSRRKLKRDSKEFEGTFKGKFENGFGWDLR